jgi:DNA transposition AAA+ family ATPase
MTANAVAVDAKTEVAAPDVSREMVHVANEYLLKQVEDLQQKLGISDAKLSQQCGFTPGVISTYKRGLYRGSIKNVEGNLEKWVREKSTNIQVKHAKYDFIDFEVHRRTKAFIELARAGNYFMTLIGPAGLGKSDSCKEITRGTIRREFNQLVYIELTTDDCSAAGLARVIYYAVGAKRDVEARTTAKAAMRAVRDKDITLILDQAHQLRVSGIQQAFDFRNACRKPMILVGNQKLLDRIRGMTEAEIDDNEQWASRVDINPPYAPCFDAHDKVVADASQTPVHWYSKAEIEKFLAMYPINFTKPFLRRCRAIADGPGHLRALDVRLRLVMNFITQMDQMTALDQAEIFAVKMGTKELPQVTNGEEEEAQS